MSSNMSPIANEEIFIRTKSLGELLEYRKQLAAQALELHNLAKEADSDFCKMAIERKKKHLKAHQESYFHIDVTQNHNDVVAILAGMIGVERTIRDDIELYENVRDKKKVVDEMIRVCDDVIPRKEKEVSSHRR
jgi:hypothetical protein